MTGSAIGTKLSGKAQLPATPFRFCAENTLTEAEALDVAAYVTKQPRPAFAGKTHDWPSGGKPADAPY